MATANKKDPKKWAAAKAKAKRKMGGKHSARAMQLATKYYKDAGGTYKGKKKSTNKLSKWSKQDWGYVSKDDEKKPKAKRKSLTPGQKAATNRKKRAATKAGKPSASYSRTVAKKVKRSK